MLLKKRGGFSYTKVKPLSKYLLSYIKVKGVLSDENSAIN